MIVKKLVNAHGRPSRKPVLSSATSIFALMENVSEAVNFPTTVVAKIILGLLKTLKDSDENEETRNRLKGCIAGVVDTLHAFRSCLGGGIDSVPDESPTKMRKLESVLKTLSEVLPSVLSGLWRHILLRDKIKSDLAAHLHSLDKALDGFKAS